MSDCVKIILASGSPRRSELLKLIGVHFEVVVPGVDEDNDVPAEPAEHVELLARRKALAVSGKHPESLVIASDTIVYHDSTILGKPDGFGGACRMLKKLAGETHQVYTGVALAGPAGEKVESFHEVTAVTFRELSSRAIEDYVRTGEPLDKAGAYGIQGYGATIVKAIDGCYFNVMGLPLSHLVQALESRGYEYLYGPLVVNDPEREREQAPTSERLI